MKPWKYPFEGYSHPCTMCISFFLGYTAYYYACSRKLHTTFCKKSENNHFGLSIKIIPFLIIIILLLIETWIYRFRDDLFHIGLALADICIIKYFNYCLIFIATHIVGVNFTFLFSHKGLYVHSQVLQKRKPIPVHYQFLSFQQRAYTH